MARINANISALIGARNLSLVGRSLNTSLERLATGLSINRGADNPAGLIASESLRAQLSALDAASRNVERADQVLSVAEAGMAEASNLLVDLRGLAVQAANSAGLTPAERDAIQLQADSVLQSIDRIASATSFAGLPLLDGSQSFRVQGASADFADVEVFAGSLEPGDSASVNVEVTQAAQQGALLLSFGGGSLDFNGGGALTLTIEGETGQADVSFASGDSLSSVAAAVNANADATGVSASVVSGSVVLRSREFGDDAFVSVEVSDAANVAAAGAGVFGFDPSDPATVDPTQLADFATQGDSARDEGVDVAGTINGAQAAGDGLTLSLNSSFLSLDVELTQAAATTTGAKPGFIVIGGPVFQISDDVSGGRVGISLPDLSTSNMGRFSDQGSRFSLADVGSAGALSLRDGDLAGASRAITGAISQVATARGRVGAFQANTLIPASRQLGAAIVNTAAAESQIRDTDFAFQSAVLNRDQVLFSAAIGALGLAQNASPTAALSLLG